MTEESWVLPNIKTALIFLISIICFALAAGQEPDDSIPTTQDTLNTPPPNVTPVMPKKVTAKDNPNDEGGAIVITWHISVDDHKGGKVTGYKIYRGTGPDQKFTEIGTVTSGTGTFVDHGVNDGEKYVYKVAAFNSFKENGRTVWEVSSESNITAPVVSSAQWFDWRRINVLVGVIFVCTAIFLYIQRAKSGKELYIRKIAGLESVDEAVGRATEMGRKIFFIPGINDMDNVQTIAGITILGRVAQIAAEYETWIEVPVSKSLVMITAKEIVKEAYSKAGRPDNYNDDQVHYLTDDQFGYAAAIDGMFVREKPAAVFYMGAFFAESLIMAETGNSVGAIQIAGTAMPSQLPFFVAACDYTLIGEELFAASAYLSREPRLLGSLKGQDIGKAAILIAILLGVLLETFGIFELSNLFKVID